MGCRWRNPGVSDGGTVGREDSSPLWCHNRLYGHILKEDFTKYILGENRNRREASLVVKGRKQRPVPFHQIRSARTPTSTSYDK